MSLSWNNVMSTRRSSRRKGFPVIKLLLGVLALGAMGAFANFYANDNAPDTPTEKSTATEGDVTKEVLREIKIELYAEETPLAGTELAEMGKLGESAKWCTNYLAAPDGRDDQAFWVLGKIALENNDTQKAEEYFNQLIRLREDSLRSGDALYQLGMIAAASGREKDAAKHFGRAIKFYAKSNGGRRSAIYVGDKLYSKYVEKKMKRTEWERIARLYSTALNTMPYGADERDEIINKLDILNSWVIFTPYARPKPNATTNIIFHRVKNGESLGSIANHYGVTIGSICCINNLAGRQSVIRIGDELKIVLGRASVEVNLEHFRLTVWLGGQFLREYTVGTGRNGRTPIGKFTIASRLIDPVWYSDGVPYQPGHPKNILGTRWLGFEKKGAGKGIGVHGSKELSPGVFQGIGKAESNGCVRMRNPEVEELFNFVPIGTVVNITE